MAEEKDSFVFYGSFYEALQDLKDKDRLKVYDAICELALRGNETKLAGIQKTIFILIKPQILANTKRYLDGKKGGRPNKKTTVFQKEETTGYENKKPLVLKNEKYSYENKKPNVNENVNVNDNENVNVNVVVEEQLQRRFIECTNSTNLNAINECISYLQDLPYEVIETALVKASEKDGGWKYAKTILQNWLSTGINTIEKVNAEEMKFRNKNKPIEETEEEKNARKVRELEESLKNGSDGVY